MGKVPGRVDFTSRIGEASPPWTAPTTGTRRSRRISACWAGCSAIRSAPTRASSLSTSSRRSGGSPWGARRSRTSPPAAWGGVSPCALWETTGRLAVASRRLEDIASRRSLAQTLDALTDDQAVLVVRAFSYFSLLANIAEDRHHIRRHRALRCEGARPLASTLRGIFIEAQEHGVDRHEALASLAPIRVTPVLTAHPTEVQRKSTLDCQLAIAGLLARLDSADLLPEERAA